MNLFDLAPISVAAFILSQAEPALARMTPSTPWMLRYSVLCQAGGALAAIFAIFTTKVPADVSAILMGASIALHQLCDNRMLALLQKQPKGEPHAQG